MIRATLLQSDFVISWILTIGTTALASLATLVMSSSKVNCPRHRFIYEKEVKGRAYSITTLSKTLYDGRLVTVIYNREGLTGRSMN
jgi:hypothetical protein